MQGYNDNSPPSSPPRGSGAPSTRPGPSTTKNDQSIAHHSPPATRSEVEVEVEEPRRATKGKGKADIGDPSRQSSPKPVSLDASTRTPNEAGPSRIPSPSVADQAPPGNDDNDDPFEGMTEEEIFRLVTRPDDLEGVEDWGIPPEVDPDQSSDVLKAKVEQFLRLKYERGQHINTTLLSSSSFANPHIYSKLVEFVDIDETATAFPSGGWMTRRNIETLIPEYGPKALAAVQKAKQEAVKRSQEIGKRSNIQFAPSRRREGDDRGSGKKRYRDEDYRDRARDGDRERYKARDRQYDGDRDRDRDRRDRR